MDILTGSSQNFFVLIASFAFALFAAARAVESIRDFRESPEDLKHLNLMLLQAVVILIIAVLPLVLSDIKNDIQVCSYLGFILSLGLLLHVIWGVFTGGIVFFYKKISLSIVGMSIIVSLAYLANAVFFTSILIYRVLLLIGFLFLCFRYYLVLGHFITQTNNSKNQ